MEGKSGQLSGKTDGIMNMLTGLKKNKLGKDFKGLQEWHWTPFWSDLSRMPFLFHKGKDPSAGKGSLLFQVNSFHPCGAPSGIMAVCMLSHFSRV